MPTIEEFYGEAAKRIRNRDKAESAIKSFEMALKAGSDGVQRRALELAASRGRRLAAGLMSSSTSETLKGPT